MPDKLAQAETDHAHEALCRRCGKCCYRKVIIGKTVRITPFPCEFLDTATNLCTIYKRRSELNRHCLSVAAGLRQHAFPADCAYVAVLAPSGYRPAREDFDWNDEWDHFEEWADELEIPAEVRAKVRARGPLAPPLYVETRLRQSLRGAGKSPLPVGREPT